MELKRSFLVTKWREHIAFSNVQTGSLKRFHRTRERSVAHTRRLVGSELCARGVCGSNYSDVSTVLHIRDTDNVDAAVAL